jgi:hypothetical protein
VRENEGERAGKNRNPFSVRACVGEVAQDERITATRAIPSFLAAPTHAGSAAMASTGDAGSWDWKARFAAGTGAAETELGCWGSADSVSEALVGSGGKARTTTEVEIAGGKRRSRPPLGDPALEGKPATYYWDFYRICMRIYANTSRFDRLNCTGSFS